MTHHEKLSCPHRGTLVDRDVLEGISVIVRSHYLKLIRGRMIFPRGEWVLLEGIGIQSFLNVSSWCDVLSGEAMDVTVFVGNIFPNTGDTLLNHYLLLDSSPHQTCQSMGQFRSRRSGTCYKYR